jgi:hypothetical protein
VPSVIVLDLKDNVKEVNAIKRGKKTKRWKARFISSTGGLAGFLISDVKRRGGDELSTAS